MPGHDIIVIGASAGGVEALRQLVELLPPDLPAAIFVVLHVPSDSTSALPKILTKWGPLTAYHPKDREQIRYGRIYVAPPDSHLLVKPGYLRLTRGPKENGFRPAADPLFRTAARFYGPRAVGVILSGTLDDGTAGVIAIKKRGGVTIAQDPNEAMYTGMPMSAIENADVDYVLPISDIASALARLSGEEVEEGGETVSDDMELEADISELEFDSLHAEKRPGTPSRFTCPECNGVLWEIDDENLLRFRCRVGHAYSSETLLAEQFDSVEAAMWAALRALEENVSLTTRLAHRMRERGHSNTAARFEKQAQEADERAEIIRRALITRSPADPVGPELTDTATALRSGESAGDD